MLTLGLNVDESKSEIERQLDNAFIEACSLEGDQQESYVSSLPDSIRPIVRQMLEDAGALQNEFLEPVVAGTTPQENLAFLGSAESFGETGGFAQSIPQVHGYKIVKKIAEGGMGVVYLAIQEPPLVRQVAIKVMPTQIRGSQVARLRAEQQSGAQLDHPNIARMFDAGITSEGFPYFVIEYVPGVPITEYCDKHQLGITQRLRLVEVACDAVQYAHQKGIIHRDIKPSNILVAGEASAPVVKVIDFGMAKIIQDNELKLGVETTREGDILGTPLYMSPEQATGQSSDVDTRADVYSLGVVLYELLTGTTPVRRERAKELVHSVLFDLIATEEPQLPSNRLKELEVISDRESIARSRNIEARSLIATVAGELDWITRKSIEIERDHRYRTPVELADDIRRYLNNDLVLASPPSRIYHFKKFVRRHRKSVLFAGSFVALLIVSTVGLGILAVQLGNEKKKASDALVVSRNATEQVTRERDRAESLVAELQQRDAEIVSKNQRLVELISSGFILLESEYGASQDGVVALMEAMQRRKRSVSSEEIIRELESGDPVEASLVSRQLCFDGFVRFKEIASRANALHQELNAANTTFARSVLLVSKMEAILTFKDDIETTRELIEKAIELEPTLGLAHLMKAEIDTRVFNFLADYGDVWPVPVEQFVEGINEQEIDREWALAVKLLPLSTHAFTGQAFWHFQNGRFTEAEEGFQAALDRDSTNDLAQLGLARLYDHLERYSEAVDAFKRAFALPVKFSKAIVAADDTANVAGRIAVITRAHLMDLEKDELAKQIEDAATVRFYGAYRSEPVIREHLGLLWEIIAEAICSMPEQEVVALLGYVLKDQEFPARHASLESTRSFALSVTMLYGALGGGAQDEKGNGHSAGEVPPLVRLELMRMDQAFPAGWECEFTDEQLQRLVDIMGEVFGEHKEAWEQFETISKRARHIDLVAQPVTRIKRE